MGERGGQGREREGGEGRREGGAQVAAGASFAILIRSWTVVYLGTSKGAKGRGKDGGRARGRRKGGR